MSVPRRLVPSTASLTAFDAVARFGSFSAAAAAIDLTPGAVSRQIAALEAQIGVRLVERTNRGVSLTAKGEAYARGIEEVLTRIRMLSLDAMTTNPPDRLSIAVLPTFGTRWLLPRIPDFVRKHPEIALNFATRIGPVDFEAEKIDAAIHVGRPDWPGCHFHLLMHETVVPMCSPEFLSRNPVPDAESLLDLPLLEMASRPHAWEHWFASLGIEGKYRKGMRFEQMMNLSQACSAGLGVALMPPFLVASEMENGQLVTAFDRPIESQGGYYFVHPVKAGSQIATLRFLHWLKQEIGDAPTTVQPAL